MNTNQLGGRFSSLLLFLLMSTVLWAQDPHYSQFYAAPTQTNPALNGIFPGKIRVTGNYRNQWSSILGGSAFQTYGASFDTRFNTLNNDYFSLSINFLKDVAGDSNFNMTRAGVGVSYMKQTAGVNYSSNAHYIILGFQAGFGQHGLDWSRLSFSSQFDQGTELFDPDALTGETFGVESITYPDLNTGFLWFATFGDNMSVYAGAALYHILEPNVSFFETESENLYRKYMVHAGGEIGFNSNLSILPAFLISVQGPSYKTNLGANFRYTNRDWNELALRAGLWTRLVNGVDSGFNNDALIFTTMLELERLLVGISYDVNMSSLRDASNSRGAFELSISYIHPEEKRFKMKCPKF